MYVCIYMYIFYLVFKSYLYLKLHVAFNGMFGMKAGIKLNSRNKPQAFFEGKLYNLFFF